jgi:hypothetical protein
MKCIQAGDSLIEAGYFTPVQASRVTRALGLRYTDDGCLEIITSALAFAIYQHHDFVAAMERGQESEWSRFEDFEGGPIEEVRT